MDVETGEETGGCIVSNSEEGLKGFLVVYGVRSWVVRQLGEVGGQGVSRNRELLAFNRFRSGKLTPRRKTWWKMSVSSYRLKALKELYHLDRSEWL